MSEQTAGCGCWGCRVRIPELLAARDAAFSDAGQEHLRRRMAGLAKGIDEEMQPGAREFCLGAVADFSDAYAGLKEEVGRWAERAEQAEAELARIRDAVGHVIQDSPGTPGSVKEMLRRVLDRPRATEGGGGE